MTARRGYSKAFPAGKDRSGGQYLLNGIPAGLWKKSQARARKEGRTMRSVLLTLLSDWITSQPGNLTTFDPAELDALQRALTSTALDDVDRPGGLAQATTTALVKVGILISLRDGAQEGAAK